MKFRDRTEAGLKLAESLAGYAGQEGVVLALPRGGVVLGVEIAKKLGWPLDLLIPRKVGHPRNPEYAICAVTEAGGSVCNESETAALDPGWLKRALGQERAEARRRRQTYLKGRPTLELAGKIAVIVDDGVATGLTLKAALESARARQPGRLVAAVPVIPLDIAEEIRRQAELVALEIPKSYLGSVGAYYGKFDQVSDQEVIELMDRVKV